MAKWGNVDYRQFQDLQKKMEKMQEAAKKEFFEAAAKELAARLLAKVIKRTPVGKYPDVPGKNGGTLRRGWTGGKRSSAVSFVNSMQISKMGNTYQIEIINPVEYASYVEYGHRTRNHKGWVPGRFMLTISEQEIDAQKEKILEKKLTKYLGELFND
jgi:phage gpG-like protein